MNKPVERPLSPHLQIYRWQMPMATSILHRMCGAALAVGIVAVLWLLVAAAAGESAWAVFTLFWGGLVGRLMLFGWSAALFYHLCNGVRHLIWDTGRLFDMKKATRAGYLVFITAAALTALLWSHVMKTQSSVAADGDVQYEVSGSDHGQD